MISSIIIGAFVGCVFGLTCCYFIVRSFVKCVEEENVH